MAIVDSINSLATRIGQEFQSIRSEITSAVSSLTSSRAAKSTTVTGATSLTGGGDLSANRTLSLVNDSASPGNSKYYGTNGSGAKGFHDLPASGGGGVSEWTLLGRVSNTPAVINIPGGNVAAFKAAHKELLLISGQNNDGAVFGSVVVPTSHLSTTTPNALNVNLAQGSQSAVIGSALFGNNGNNFTQINLSSNTFTGQQYFAALYYR